MHAAPFSAQSMHTPPEAKSHKSPTCATLAPVAPGMMPQSVLQAASHTDLDLFDSSASPCSLCDVFRHVLCGPSITTYCHFELWFLGGRLEAGWGLALQAARVECVAD